MLGNFITNGFVLVFGYAYPAFECYKTIERNKIEIAELRFWCQYWIIVAALRIFESFGDLFLSWLSIYGHAKLAVFIYLWYSKTKGTTYIYDNILKPFVAKHETDIDRNLLEFRANAWDLGIYYWQNCSDIGQVKFWQLLSYVASQSKRGTQPNSEKKDEFNHSREASPRIPSGLFKRNNKQTTDTRSSPVSSSPSSPSPSPRPTDTKLSPISLSPSSPSPRPTESGSLDDNDFDCAKSKLL
ncbi:putative HVA22-like protein g [Capsicum galapagoense]